MPNTIIKLPSNWISTLTIDPPIDLHIAVKTKGNPRPQSAKFNGYGYARLNGEVIHEVVSWSRIAILDESELDS